MKIIIVGGGTAGWMTSLYLSHTRPQHQYITIESEDISTIGVGEATTGKFNEILQDCGIDIIDFMKKTSALPKHGVRLVNWGKENGEFDSPLEYSTTAYKPIDYRLYYQYLTDNPIEHASISGLYTKNYKTT
jgi:tryptophan halogenase